MRKQYVKHRIENLVNIAKIVTIHYYELDKNFSYRANRTISGNWSMPTKTTYAPCAATNG